eukprot:TRINITY_DN822_c0_g1_i11.p1 TRINITY_DN822_c0_g1~~TRINITY_DN822_c0_g1_i11.p1  ORF type:complete len:103 (-),score=2.34 TRINITY_DN822_c0_g1_i11:202-510(-)
MVDWSASKISNMFRRLIDTFHQQTISNISLLYFFGDGNFLNGCHLVGKRRKLKLHKWGSLIAFFCKTYLLIWLFYCLNLLDIDYTLYFIVWDSFLSLFLVNL